MSPNDDPLPQDVESALRDLRPAESQMDPSNVFYQAGYQAAVASRRDAGHHSALPFAIGALLTAAVVWPISFQAGKDKGQIIAQQESDAKGPSATLAGSSDASALAPSNFDPPEVTDASEEPQSTEETAGPTADELPNAWASVGKARVASWLELLGSRWRGVDEITQSQGTTLTAATASNLATKDFHQTWPEISFGDWNRYQTGPMGIRATRNNEMISISDTVQVAENLGGF